MVNNLFTSGKYTGVPFEQIPWEELGREYVRNDAITPIGRMLAGLVLTNRISVGATSGKPRGLPWVDKPQVAPSAPVVEAKKVTVAPDLAEQFMQTLEWYANQPNGEKARAVLIRLYAEKG